MTTHIGASSDLFISFDRCASSSEEDGEPRYHRAQPVWVITVEQHHDHFSLLQKHATRSGHITAVRDDDSNTYLVRHRSADGIIGSILIGEKVHGSLDHIHKVLLEGIDETFRRFGGEMISDQDEWLRAALHILQSHGLVRAFDVNEFMTFAHSFVALRNDHQGTSVVVYPKWHSNKEGKPEKRHSWSLHATKASEKT